MINKTTFCKSQSVDSRQDCAVRGRSMIFWAVIGGLTPIVAAWHGDALHVPFRLTEVFDSMLNLRLSTAAVLLESRKGFACRLFFKKAQRKEENQLQVRVL